ncbi:MAG: DNA polymerase III subunit beta [Sedimentisphaerales bacterium]|nr:DNA polymerase III subunit beta [Sedimentisphaerales bacterium]
MKVTCNRSALCEAAQLAATIAPSRTPKPILLCAKLEADADSNQLTVLATDNEIMVRYLVNQVDVGASGTAVIPADRLTSILRESMEDTLELEMTDSTCQIKGKDSQFHIYGHDPDDFPEIPKAEVEADLEVQAGKLRWMIDMTTFAAARENTRYAINGVFWEQQGKKLRLVATDGRRLAKAELDLKGADKNAEQTVIVPLKTMSVIERVLHDPDEMVKISFSSNQVVVRTALAEVSSNLMQGRFPKYADVIPTDCATKVSLGTSTLLSAVKRVALLTTEHSKGVELDFCPGSLRLASSAPEAGDAEITMALDYEGEAMKIGFNPQYLLEMLRAVESDEVVLELTDGSKPGLFRAGKDFLYVVMPVTV